MSSTMSVVDSKAIIRRHWDSFESFVADMRRPGCSGNPTHSITGPSWWCGTSSYDQALQLANNGWPEGLKRMEKLRGQLRAIETELAERHVCVFAESGDEVDIGRFVSGEPECMTEFEVVKVPAAGRVVKLVCNIAASQGVEADAMFLRGAAAVMLADLLEQSGLRTEIVVASAGYRSSTSGPDGVCFTVNVKRADQPLELDRLAFMLAQPSVFRRLMFRAYEQLPKKEFNRAVGSAYTRPMNADLSGPGVIMVDTLQYGFGNELNSTEQAVKFINTMFDSIIERK